MAEDFIEAGIERISENFRNSEWITCYRRCSTGTEHVVDRLQKDYNIIILERDILLIQMFIYFSLICLMKKQTSS